MAGRLWAWRGAFAFLLIQVFGEKDADGFYQGESGGRHGYVPCNMVSEIQVDDEETRAQLLQQGFLPTEASIEKTGKSSTFDLSHRPTAEATRLRSSLMSCCLENVFALCFDHT